VTTILSFVFVLGVLIFVHELGHFLMARRIGVRVLTFSLGFGPKILTVKRGDTEYCISAIPLGGYVKMAGENPEDARTGASDEFLSKSKWQRFQVLVMGPVMNLALAWVVMALVLFQGAPTAAAEEQAVVIGSFKENSVAQAAGLQVGDRITELNGEPVANWKDFEMAVVTKANRQIFLTVERDGKTFRQPVTPASVSKFEMGDLGVLPIMNPEIVMLNSGEAAATAGLQVGDVVMGAAGEKNVSRDRIVELIKAHADKPLTLDVKRDERIIQIPVTPRVIDGVPRIGATFQSFETIEIEPGFFEAFELSAIQNWEWTKLILTTLKGLFTADTPVKQLMGPVGIAEMSGNAAEAGWIPLFTLMAMISLNLGLLNLMPIPVLDGGHIMILALEGVSRRDFSMKVKEKMLLVGFVLLVTLMVTVIYNDLTRVEWLKRLMPWRN
jgi:regulator of sigma E protease